MFEYRLRVQRVSSIFHCLVQIVNCQDSINNIKSKWLSKSDVTQITHSVYITLNISRALITERTQAHYKT